MTYQLVYGALLLAGMFTINGHAARKFLYFGLLLALLVFAGFRFEVGCDWGGYLSIFEAQRYDTYADALQKSEPGFWVANDILQALGLDYPYINVIAAVTFFFGFHLFARRQPDPLGMLILSFPVLILNLPMSAIRQAIALGFLCIAFNAFVDRRIVRFIVLVATASLFHLSSIVFLFLVPLIQGKLSWVRLVLASLLILPGAYFMTSDHSFATYSERYIESDLDAAGSIFRTGVLAVTAVTFFLFLSRDWRRMFPSDYKLAWISSALMLMAFLVTFVSPVIGDRFGYYLVPVQLMILSRLSFFFRGNALAAAVPYAALGVLLLVWTTLSSLFQQCYLPYQLWW